MCVCVYQSVSMEYRFWKLQDTLSPLFHSKHSHTGTSEVQVNNLFKHLVVQIFSGRKCEYITSCNYIPCYSHIIFVHHVYLFFTVSHSTYSRAEIIQEEEREKHISDSFRKELNETCGFSFCCCYFFFAADAAVDLQPGNQNFLLLIFLYPWRWRRGQW